MRLVHANASDRRESEELHLFLLEQIVDLSEGVTFCLEINAHDQVLLQVKPSLQLVLNTDTRLLCKQAPTVCCWCRFWRDMTTYAHQQLSHTRPASTCLTSVGRQKAPNPNVSVVPARNLAGHRKLHANLQTYGPRVAATARTAPPSTSQQAPQQSKELRGKGLSAAEGRQLLVDSIPLESFKMAGVSFEGRQDAVSKLRPGKEQIPVPE